MKTQGIYKITNQINNNIYIGQSSNIELREQYHKKDLTSFNINTEDISNLEVGGI